VQGCKRTPKRFYLSKIRAKYRENLGKIYENVHKIPVILDKLPENTDKHGPQRCLILKNWRPTREESHEDLFLEVIPKMMKYSHKELPETFSGKFREIWAKILCTPKNLTAPTSMLDNHGAQTRCFLENVIAFPGF